MADKEKKIAAALAAVTAYLHMEESEAAARLAPLETALVPPIAPSFWSQSGRQEMMTMRRLIQMRTFTSFR
ncbi:MAG: hypothetical protein IH612_19470 [Desulfofustis sp.]|nr:hypothetical protein [Desulfofustis sp.]